MTLNFQISKEMLLITGLMQEPKIDNWKKLQDTLWEKYKPGYQLLQGNYRAIFSCSNYKEILNQSVKDMGGIISEGMKSSEFAELLVNAKNHKIWLEKQWQQKKELINKELVNILKTNVPEELVTVYVLGTLLHEGRNLNGKIFWGQFEHWQNYSLVYLVHEYLHGLLKYSEIEHAIIELIADNEMRIRLNKEGVYFVCNGEQVGHKHLQVAEKLILNDWKEYLKNKEVNIHQFVEKMKQKYPQYSKEESEKL